MNKDSYYSQSYMQAADRMLIVSLKANLNTII